MLRPNNEIKRIKSGSFDFSGVSDQVFRLAAKGQFETVRQQRLEEPKHFTRSDRMPRPWPEHRTFQTELGLVEVEQEHW